MSDRPTVCGFCFGKDLTALNYPVEAAVQSILPLCDRFVFAVGQSEDDTRERVAAIDPAGEKLEIVDTVWPEDVREGGTVLAIEANKAFAAAEATGCDWGFYIQADEVVHEDDLPILEKALRHWHPQEAVKGLLFRYHHFVLDYQTVDPWMYHKQCRLIRLDGSCEIYGDACGPWLKAWAENDPDGAKLNRKHHRGKHVQWARDPELGRRGRKARIFHYGWVKTREQLEEKFAMAENLWWGTLDESQKKQLKHDRLARIVDRYPIMKKFHDTHPAVMRSWIEQHPPFAELPNRWLHPRFYAEIARHGFHG